MFTTTREASESSGVVYTGISLLGGSSEEENRSSGSLLRVNLLRQVRSQLTSEYRTMVDVCLSLSLFNAVDLVANVEISSVWNVIDQH